MKFLQTTQMMVKASVKFVNDHPAKKLIPSRTMVHGLLSRRNGIPVIFILGGFKFSVIY
jgi:hypothetical protein